MPRFEGFFSTIPEEPKPKPFDPKGATTFSEGVHVGYRWFDKQKIAPIFPFGHGLSYTKFAYSELKTEATSDGGLDVSFEIRNTGEANGDDVPQVYLGAPKHQSKGPDFAVRALAAFERVHLDAGQSQTINLHVPLRRLQYWSEKENKWIKAAGPREIAVGGSSRDLPLSGEVNVQ